MNISPVDHGLHRLRCPCSAVAGAQAAAAPRAVERETSIAGRPRALVAPVRKAVAVLRVRRSAVLHGRRRAARDRPGAAQRLHAARGSVRAAFPQNGGRVRRNRARRIGRAIHGALSRAVSVQRVRAAASEGRQLPAVLERRGGHRSRRQPALRSHGFVRRECLRLRLLQRMHRARRTPWSRTWARCSAATTP